MKKFNLFIVISLLSFFTCFSFSDVAPVYNWRICNVITNLDEYLKDYYMVIDCDDLWCNNNRDQPFIIINDNTKCFSWWGNVYLVPNYIEFESLRLIDNGTHLDDKREIRIWMLRDKSEHGDLTHIYKMIRDSNWIQYNGTWIKLELINEYEWYNTRSETKTQETKNTIEIQNATSSNLLILWIIVAFCVVVCCIFILAYLSIKFFKNKKGQN